MTSKYYTTMEKINSRLLFLDSANHVKGNGEASTWTIQNQADFSAMGSGRFMKVCLTSFSMFKNYYNLNETNTIFYAVDAGTLAHTEIIIPKGDYDGFDTATGILNPIAPAIQAAIISAGYTGATVAFNNLTRQYSIDMSGVSGWVNGTDYFMSYEVKVGTPPAGVSAYGYFNGSAGILGGRVAKDVNGITLLNKCFDYVGAKYVSPFVAQLSTIDEIIIRCDLPSMNYQSSGFDRSQGYTTAITQTDILGRVPVNRQTLDPTTGQIHYQDFNNNFELMMGNVQLNSLTLYLTDGAGRIIQEVAPGQAKNGSLSYRATLRFDYMYQPQPQSRYVANEETMNIRPINIGRG